MYKNTLYPLYFKGRGSYAAKRKIGYLTLAQIDYLTVFESLQLMFGFGIFIISLLTLVVVLIKFDKKNQIEFDISKNYNACNFQ
ncbi:hypothetical protein BFC19_05270 [Brochothrix thermosphacta]|nr:hypothetical protein BFC19_05270 [Brochothrix thermosphacta]